MRTRKTLEERIDRIQQYNPQTGRWPTTSAIVRAEYALLAKILRKMRKGNNSHPGNVYYDDALNDALGVIESLKQ